MAIGVTFLNNHCYVNDVKLPDRRSAGMGHRGRSTKTATNKGSKDKRNDYGPTLLKRSVELQLEIYQTVLGWNMLVIDQAEYLELFN